MSSGDDLGDRMKRYEANEAGRRLMPLLPALARIDGRAFHSFTRGMDRPFDAVFSRCMLLTTSWLVQETGALVGYTQSDEITLAWYSDDPSSQVFFDGRVAKMTSQLAALASVRFNELVAAYYPAYLKRRPTFDARVWNVPNLSEAANVFVWRELDATKNSLSMAAAALYSHNELLGKNGAQKHEMLFAKGVNWNNYEPAFKRGQYLLRRTRSEPFSASELEALPPLHEARKNPGLMVERTKIQAVDLPPILQVANRVGLLFRGEEPVPLAV